VQGGRFALRVRVHGASSLERPRSLEAFIARFGRGRRLYDPAGVFVAADRLVSLAGALRIQLGDDLRGVFWSSRLRTLYVLLHESAYGDAFGMLRDRLIAAEQAVGRAIAASAGGEPRHRGNGDMAHSVRLCLQLPAVPLVPVDAPSSSVIAVGRLGRPHLARLNKLAPLARVPLLSALLGMGSAAAATGLPAESRPMLIGTDNVAMLATRDTPWKADSGGASGNPEAGSARAAYHVFPGDGLNLLWRDPFGGTIEGNASYDAERSVSGPEGNGIGSERHIGREHFAATARSGVPFGARGSIADEGACDVTWYVGDKPAARDLPEPQPGVSALAGLCSLAGRGWSAAAYDAVLEHLQAHFGPPRSLQHDVLRHAYGPADVAGTSRQGADVLGRGITIAQSRSYQEWLQNQRQNQARPRPPPRNDWDRQQETRPYKRGPGSSR
jgi:hypothetical protein